MDVSHFYKDITADGSGNATVDFPFMKGRINSIKYTKHGSNAFDDTVDFTVTSLSSNQTILDVDNITATTQWAVRQAVVGSDGAAIAGASDHYLLKSETLRVAVAGAGAANQGRIDVVMEN